MSALRIAAIFAFGLQTAAFALAEPKPATKGSTAPSSGTLQPAGALACTTLPTACNTTVSGELTADDCRLPEDQSFYDAWTVSLAAGQTIQITMRSTAFDTFLFLFDPSGLEVEDNNNFPGEGSNSRIRYTADVTGTYTIYANSFAAGQTGTYSLEVLCTQPPGPCTAGPTTVCLNNGRFRAQAIFSAPSLGITNAAAQAVPLTSDTGYFWFFSSNNVEIVLKVVDGRAFNNFFWVFYGALSDVAYTITVTDTTTGAVKTYSNPQGQLASRADVTAFPGGAPAAAGATPADSVSAAGPMPSPSNDVARLLSASAPLACLADGTTLCLNNGRFQVQAIFTAPSLGITNAPAQAVPLTSDTGYFWFFSSNNVEIVLKVVDGRGFNGFFWVFYGALSDVAYTITVTDTTTGAVKTYSNPQGQLASRADVSAF